MGLWWKSAQLGGGVGSCCSRATGPIAAKGSLMEEAGTTDTWSRDGKEQGGQGT